MWAMGDELPSLIIFVVERFDPFKLGLLPKESSNVHWAKRVIEQSMGLRPVKIHKTDIALICIFLFGVAVYPVFPLVVWLLPFAGLLVYALLAILHTSPRHRTPLLTIAACTMFFQLLVGLAVGFHDPSWQGELRDDLSYLREANAIAQAWREGFFPELSLKGSLPYLGTLHTGYQRFVAGLFYLFGNDYRIPILANYLLLGLLPIAVYRAAFLLLSQSRAKVELTPHLSRVPLFAACCIAFYPNLGYWASFLLKDALLTVFMTCSLSAVLEFLGNRRLAWIPVVLTLGFMIGITRAYALFGLLAGCALYGVAMVPRKWVFGTCLAGLLVLVGMSYTTRGADYLSQLIYSLSVQLPDHLRTVPQAVAYFAGAIPRLLLSPYAWVRAFGANPAYELYPGMWMLYLMIYPLGLLGLFNLAKHDVRIATIPFGMLVATGLVLILAYGGDAPRQRLCLDPTWFIFAGTVQSLKRREWVLPVVWYAVFILYALVQLATLQYRY